jgi:cell shape-determining protein MreD
MSGEPARPVFAHRVDQLASRVRWLDRYRRLLAIIAATLIAPILIAHVAGVLGGDWPQIHATVLSVMLGVIVWWVIEVGLVYVTALWETEHDQLLRDRGLPRAVLRRWRLR